jgi:DNA polymerase-3 subunit epsilon
MDENRNQSIKVAREKIDLNPLYLDTETTGLDPQAEIVEITIIDDDENVLIDSLVRPQHPIPPSASRIHGITDAMVSSAPSWADLSNNIQTIISGRVVGIYNVEYDLRMMQQSHLQYGLKWPKGSTEFFCIMQLYAQYYGQWDEYRQSFRWQSLENACRQCNINLSNLHRAKDDTLLTRTLLHHIAHSQANLL